MGVGILELLSLHLEVRGEHVLLLLSGLEVSLPLRREGLELLQPRLQPEVAEAATMCR